MNVLLTNDDGIDAPGLRALVQCLSEKVNLRVVAPASERSASSHSISLGQKLRVEEFFEDSIRKWMVHGTPADCVKFAVSELKDFRADLVISGINQGANTGVSVYYSGTISAAREALINGIPSVAVSLASGTFENFGIAASFVKRFVEGCGSRKFPSEVMLNVNIPALAENKIKGVKITKQAASRFIEEFVKEKQHDGKRVYTLVGEMEILDPDGTSDEEAVSGGYISVTPLKLDLTDYAAMPIFEKWMGNQRRRKAVCRRQ